MTISPIEIEKNKDQIAVLFDNRNIISPVTTETVALALKEEGLEFEKELGDVLYGNTYKREPLEVRSPESTTPSKGQNAMDWVNTIGGIVVPLGTGIASSISNSKNPQPMYVAPNPQPVTDQNNNNKILIAVLVVIVIAISAFLVFNKKK